MKRCPEFVVRNIAPLAHTDNINKIERTFNFVFKMLICKRLANNAIIVHNKAVTASTAPFQFDYIIKKKIIIQCDIAVL